MSEKIKYKGFIIKVVNDCYPLNPRTEWDNVGIMACMHKKYNLGDYEWVKEHPEFHPGNFNSIEEHIEFIEKEYDAAIILPLYLYDHSGITISTEPFSCPWDSGQVGFIFVAKEVVEKKYGNLGEKALERTKKLLLSEVEVYDSYIRGDVYGFKIFEENNKELDGDEYDSCYGFYGYDHEKSGLLSEARGRINRIIKRRTNKARSEKLKHKHEIRKQGEKESKIVYE